MNHDPKKPFTSNDHRQRALARLEDIIDFLERLLSAPNQHNLDAPDVILDARALRAFLQKLDLGDTNDLPEYLQARCETIRENLKSFREKN
jgi:hypothetical protein